MPVSFNTTPEELALIEQIAERADREIFSKFPEVGQTKMDTIMDLSATIAQGCPLKLEALLAADAFNFTHDITGIRRHINRTTGQLENCFLPRFADTKRMQD